MSESTKRILIADGNNLLYRAFSTLKTNRDAEQVLCTNFLGLVFRDALALRCTGLEIAFDGDKIFRYKVYKDYKGERHASKEEKRERREMDDDYVSNKLEVYQVLPLIRERCAELSIPYVQPLRHEADDVLRTRGHQFEGVEGVRVYLDTRDKDSFQSLASNVRLYDSINKNKLGEHDPIIIKPSDCVEKFGVPVKQVIDFQSLYGDKGDSVPNLMGMREIKKLLAEYGSVAKWAKKSKEGQLWMAKHRVPYERNRKLVTLVTDCVPEQDLDYFTVPKQHAEGMSRSWYDWQAFMYPKTRGLFSIRK